MPVTLKGGTNPDAERQKIMQLLHGPPGSGKTTQLLSMRSPLLYVNFDREIDHLIAKLPDHYEVHYEQIPYDIDITPASATRVLATVNAMLDAAIHAKAGAFVMDGFDLWWEYVKVAKLPREEQGKVAARLYADANTTANRFLGRAYAADLDIGIAALSKEIWNRESSGSGKYESEGFKHHGRWITHKIYLFPPEDVTPKEKPIKSPETGQSHYAYIQVSKLNEELVRMVLPSLSYKLLYKMTFGDLPPDHERLWVPA
jgi:hypothetical protein